MNIIGIDPGQYGAIALWDSSGGQLFIEDIPGFKVSKGGNPRRTIDEVALENIVQFFASLNPQLIVLEQVSGRGGQSASAAFTFGDGFGTVRTLFRMYTKCQREFPVPQVWKKKLKVGTEDADIVSRADNIFPGYSNLWRGPKGGYKHDRAEAALLAYYGGLILNGNAGTKDKGK